MAKIVFMGTPQFAVASLAKILDSGFFVSAVVTVPDKPAGRGLKMLPSPVKVYAQEKNIPVLQPEDLNSPDFIAAIQNLAPDIIAVVAFRKLPKCVWSIPKLGTFNVHSSLLPQYRGAAPMNHAIINGETKTGITTFLLDDKIDTGQILLQSEVSIEPADTFLELHDKMMVVGADLAVKTTELLLSGNYTTINQNQLLAEDNILHKAPKIFKEDCKIDWNDSVIKIHNKVRGLSPVPCAFTDIQTKNGTTVNIKIYKSEYVLDNLPHEVGAITTDGKKYFGINAADGILYFKDVQLSGKKRMSIEDFLRGARNLFL